MFSKVIEINKIKNSKFQYYKNFSQKDFTSLFTKLSYNDNFFNYDLGTIVFLNKNVISFLTSDCIKNVVNFESFERAIIYYFNNDYYDNVPYKLVLLNYLREYDKIKWNLYSDKDEILSSLLDLYEDEKILPLCKMLLNLNVGEEIVRKIVYKCPSVLFEKSNNDEFFIFELKKFKIETEHYSEFFFNFQGNIKSKEGKNILMIDTFNNEFSLFTKILETSPFLLFDKDVHNRTLFHYIKNRNILYEIFINDFRLIKTELMDARSLDDLIPIDLIGELISISIEFENFINEFKDIIF